jgi:hypothetical protein
MGEERIGCGVLVAMPRGNRPLGRPWRRWEDGFRMDPRQIGWGGGVGVDSPGSGYRGRQPAFVNTVMNLRVMASCS